MLLNPGDYTFPVMTYCMISQANISAIENGRVDIGKQRANVFAEALNVHPASIMFADYDVAA